MKILAVIPARCGSKGFPNKNIAKIKGKTLLEWAVKVGLDCDSINDVYISTDCNKYENIAKKAGAKSLGLRPKELASDSSKTIDVIIDLLNNLEETYDYLVLLQPTSPIRTSEDIKNMIELVEKSKAEGSVSICEFEEPHPYKLKKIDKDGFVNSFLEDTTSEVPRQSLPKVYALNGAIYLTKISTILNKKTFLPKKTIPYFMPNNINIDSEEDFIFLEGMLEKGKVEIK